MKDGVKRERKLLASFGVSGDAQTPRSVHGLSEAWRFLRAQGTKVLAPFPGARRMFTDLLPLVPPAALRLQISRLETSPESRSIVYYTRLATVSEGLDICAYILTTISILIIIATFPVSLIFCIKVVQEYERAVIFRLGRLLRGGAKGPGGGPSLALRTQSAGWSTLQGEKKERERSQPGLFLSAYGGAGVRRSKIEMHGTQIEVGRRRGGGITHETEPSRRHTHERQWVSIDPEGTNSAEKKGCRHSRSDVCTESFAGANFPENIPLCDGYVQGHADAFRLEGTPAYLSAFVPTKTKPPPPLAEDVFYGTPPLKYSFAWILSKDSVTVAVDAVVYYRISNATIAVSNVEDYGHSTRLLAATTLRNVLGTKNLSEILSERESISHVMQASLDEATDPWGVKVERVEIKDVRLPVQLQRAMAAEAEAAREARAKVIAAEGEQRASRSLKEAAEVIADTPSALQLRYLQTLASIAAEKNSTIVFPIPMELFSGFINSASCHPSHASGGGGGGGDVKKDLEASA
ncbi:hypothetical protein HPB50_027255 [Hyalomma asiaticum]|uniref:Uncharacterized protein n=1 Tax=Hyalomma asiaticum TaxID=266040 RepID=A0ACB7TPX3_HYAAI|nr:hypothetical protein HPB50_027255 [Hyalomma asiaticum]